MCHGDELFVVDLGSCSCQLLGRSQGTILFCSILYLRRGVSVHLRDLERYKTCIYILIVSFKPSVPSPSHTLLMSRSDCEGV